MVVEGVYQLNFSGKFALASCFELSETNSKQT